jgi:hypothetical protein
VNGFLSVNIDGTSVVIRDVPISAWFAIPVNTVLQAGIATGYRNDQGRLTGLFGPANPVTYAEIAKMTLLAAGKAASGVPQNRSARTDWSAPYIATAEALHFSVYRTSQDVRHQATRGEVVQTLLEAFSVPLDATGPNPFHDLTPTHPHAAALLTAHRLGLITGDTDGKGNLKGAVRPDAPINRAEVSKILSAAMVLLRK